MYDKEYVLWVGSYSGLGVCLVYIGNRGTLAHSPQVSWGP